MTFQAIEKLVYAQHELLRFTRKNSIIDIPLQTFQSVATFEGDTAVYRVPFKNDILTLKWSVRKALRTVRCLIYKGNFCTQAEIPYLQSGRVTYTNVSDSIVITTLQFFDVDKRNKLCKILGLQLGIALNCIYNVRDNVFAFSADANNLENIVKQVLNQILREQNMVVSRIDKQQGSVFEYYVSLTVRE